MAKKSRPKLSDFVTRVLSVLGFLLSLLFIAYIYYSFVFYCHIFLVDLLVGLALSMLIGRLAMWFFREVTRPKTSDYKRLANNIASFFNELYGGMWRKH